MHPWDSALLEKARYKKVFARLQEKVAGTPERLRSAPVHPELSLSWTLNNESLVTRAILTFLKSPDSQWDPYKLSALPQGPNKIRKIFISSWGDRVLQLVMADILIEKTQSLLSDHVYSFIPGRGPHHAIDRLSTYIAAHQPHPLFALKRDISQYGDSIPHSILLDKLANEAGLGKDSKFHSLLLNAFRNPFFTQDAPETLTSAILGIPSGSPLVPPIENFYLLDLDRALSAFAGACYIRYGDDFVFVHPDREVVNTAASKIDEIVASLGLTIKDQKRLSHCLLPHYETAKFPHKEFSPAKTIEVLGRRIDLRGNIGPKREKYASLRKTFRKTLIQLLLNTSSDHFSEEERLQITSQGLHDYFFYSSRSPLQEMVYASRSERIAREFDRFKTELMVREIRKHWKIGTGQAWKTVKALRCPSVLHLYRKFHYNGLRLQLEATDEDLRLIA